MSLKQDALLVDHIAIAAINFGLRRPVYGLLRFLRINDHFFIGPVIGRADVAQRVVATFPAGSLFIDVIAGAVWRLV